MINIRLDNNDLVIKGNKDDLSELANYIKDLINSNNNKDHIHLDELTIIDNNSSIKSMIIEKE